MNRFIRTIAAVAAAAAFSGAGAAQWTPSKPIKMIVPFSPAGAADITARSVSDKLAAALGQPVVVDNRGGAGGIIGTEVGAKSPPDGYTLIVGSDPPYTINPHLQKVPYDPLRDFEHVSLIAEVPLLLLVNPGRVPANNLKELITLAKANPGKYTMASSGSGSSGHLAGELLKHEARIDLVHVPYKGQAQALTDVIGGQTDMVFSSIGAALQHLKTRKLKAIGISVTKRFAVLPDVPTLAEAGLPGYDLGVWIGASYPAGTPKAAVERVNAEINRILDMPEVRARFAELGYVPVGGKPEVLARIEKDYALFGKLIRDAKIKAE
ncbi:MAG TPA: tripartite tricarboxylate transporter substrate binding protein [Burkholderiales bacterium]|nr:tripartite tricarboxylate transporter substrate binding protein [Burkholderiales bacterium]